MVVVLGLLGVVCGLASAGILWWWSSQRPSEIMYDGVYEPLPDVNLSTGYNIFPLEATGIGPWLYAQGAVVVD
ncbi:hypothetical protein EV641_1351 [Rhodococcus sp. SMB37]|nr:hypothetical protein EV641_1351 [Rhodococcus sp. SMB37]